MSAAPFAWAEALEAMNGCMCAYQIRSVTTKKGKDGHITRTEIGHNGTYAYDVMPEFQDAAGFDKKSDVYTPHFYSHGEDDIDAALFGKMTGDRVMLAFRGTLAPNFTRHDIIAWIRDWIQDSEAGPEPWPPGSDGSSDAETGFVTALHELWKWIEKKIDPLCTSKDAKGGLIITGHSKGGAMTFLAAALARAKWPDLPITVYAFAPPVSGNAAFASAYEAAGLAETTHRIQVTEDAVPYLPRWDQADIWEKIKPTGVIDRAGWDLLVDEVDRITKEGYTAVGDGAVITDADGSVSYGPQAAQTSLDVVVSALEAEKYEDVAAAHSSLKSYLPRVRCAAKKAGA